MHFLPLIFFVTRSTFLSTLPIYKNTIAGKKVIGQKVTEKSIWKKVTEIKWQEKSIGKTNGKNNRSRNTVHVWQYMKCRHSPNCRTDFCSNSMQHVRNEVKKSE